MGKGGGSAPAQPTQQTVTQTNLPEYARPYFEDLLQRGQAASQVQYQPYQGERVAGFTPLQEQAFQGVQNLGPSPLLQPAAGLTGASGLGGLFAGQQYQQMATDPGATAAYMSPYMQNVVDFQKSQAIRDYGRQLPGMQAAATRAGAFGGSRQAIVESEAQRNLQNQLAGIQATGTQSAFDAARQAQQFGSQLGLQGLGLAGQMGQQFGALGQTAFGQQAAAAQAQQQAGAIQQAQEQQRRDLAYEESMRQQLYPQSQLQFYSSLLRGVPVAPQQTMYQYQPAPSMVSQLGGLGLGALGLSNAFRAKEGGEVPGYADGGVTGEGGLASNVSKMVKLLMASQSPERDIMKIGGTRLEKALALEKVRQMRGAAQNQAALQGGEPQGTVLDDQAAQMSAGVGSLDVPEEVFTAANGGIVAFQQAGSVDVNAPGVDTDALARELDEARAAAYGMRAPGLLQRRRDPAAMETYNQAIRRLRAAETAYQSGIGSQVPAAFGQAIRTPVDVAPPVGLPSALPDASRVPSAVGEPEQLAKGPTSITAPAAPKPDLRQQTPPAQAAATAAPAVQPEAPKAMFKPMELLNATDEGNKVYERITRAAPSELKENLADIEARMQQAKSDRDQGLWLSVAEAGFAAMAGKSPHAAVNFGEAFLGGAKSAKEVVKLYQDRQDALKKAEREERKIDRAERIGNEKMRLAAEQRAQDYNARVGEANEKLKAKWDEIRVAEFGIKERSRVGMAGVAATQAGTAEARAARTQAAQEANAVRRAEVYRKTREDVISENPLYATLNRKVREGTATKTEFARLQNLKRDIETQINKVMAVSGYGAAAPQAGQVQDGYRFKGGNPADPNSWEKI